MLLHLNGTDNSRSFRWHRTPNSNLALLVHTPPTASGALDASKLAAFSLQPGTFKLSEVQVWCFLPASSAS